MQSHTKPYETLIPNSGEMTKTLSPIVMTEITSYISLIRSHVYSGWKRQKYDKMNTEFEC